MQIAIVLLAVVFVLSVLWRKASSRHALPCPAWLSWMVELDNPFTKVSRAATIIDSLEVAEGMRVLDAGCGPGRLTLPLAKAVGKSGKVWAVDVQQSMLDRVVAKAADANLTNVTVIRGALGVDDPEMEPLPDEYFDRIFLVTVLGEIPSVENAQVKALSCLFDAMRCGGILGVTEILFDPHFQSQKHVRTVAEQAGFLHGKTEGSRLAYTMQFRKG